MGTDPHVAATLSLLQAVRNFGDAHDRMGSGMKRGMKMNITDVATLRLLIIREDAARAVTPVQIARHLGISTASTTKLLDRLETSGHVERRPHPTDRRGRIIVLTDAARREFYEQFGERLRFMRAATGEFTPQELLTATKVLAAMSTALDTEN